MTDRENDTISYKSFIAGELALICAVIMAGSYTCRDISRKNILSGDIGKEYMASSDQETEVSEQSAQTVQNSGEIVSESESSIDSAAYIKVQEDGEYVSEVVSPAADRKFAGKEMILINPWHLIPEDYEVELEPLEYGHQMDACAAEHMRDMLEDCREEGYSPLICSSYRERGKQENLFENDVRRFMYSGMTEEEAIIETARNVAVPGSSEHEAGLAADVVYSGRQILDESQEDNETQQWLMEHCWEYGFILRYPKDKQEITGITYEPWHYRYVGREAAEYIMSNGMCLEEYLGVIDTGSDFVWMKESEESGE